MSGAVTRARARDLKLTPEVHKTIIAHLQAGVPFKYACEAAGIPERRAYKWLDKGKDAESGPHADFAFEVMKARAMMIADNQGMVSRAARFGDWKAAAWNLEKLAPSIYGRKQEAAVGPAPARGEVFDAPFEEVEALLMPDATEPG